MGPFSTFNLLRMSEARLISSVAFSTFSFISASPCAGADLSTTSFRLLALYLPFITAGDLGSVTRLLPTPYQITLLPN